MNALKNTPNASFLDRYLTLLGHLTYAILAVGALVYWRERTIMLDASFQSFYTIFHDKLAIQVDRYGAAFVQSFPLWVARWGCSLKNCLMAYSLAFVLFHWLCFFIADKILKVKSLAFAILLFSTIMTAHSFFWTQNEIIQSCSFLLLFFAFLLNRQDISRFRRFDYPLSVFMVFTLYYFHPLTLFPFLFLMVYFLSFNNFPKFLNFLNPKTSTTIPISGRLLLLTGLAWGAAWATKHYYTGVSSYDKGSSGRFETHFVRGWVDLLQGPSITRFWQHCTKEFIVVIPFLLAITVFYAYQKQFLRLFLFLGASLGFIFLVSTAYFDAPDHHWFYLETQYLPLAVILALPFAFELTPSVVKPKMGLWLVGGLLFFRILYIQQTSTIYKQRLDYIKTVMQKAQSSVGGTKFYVREKDLDEKNRLFMSWGLPYETLYLSALLSPDSTTSIVAFNDNDWQQTAPLKDVKNQWATPWWNLPYKDFKPRLFNFRDTTNGYKVLEKKDLE